MKPDPNLLRRLMIDIANRPISEEPPHIQYPDVDEMTVNWHLAHLIEINLLKGKVLGSSMAPTAVAILGITPAGSEFLKGKQKDTSSDAVFNISHSTITFGDKNKIQSISSQNSMTQTAPAQTAAIKKILISVVVAVLSGLIVWYLTH